ncbi:MAG TPA: hypothetical protein ENI22_02520 [Candidatus Pacearchaeota archaeon]|nr:hypothetical protein [Candidatus Pacearchaeota archaeon]
MTLEEELLEKGFNVMGPFTEPELGKAMSKLFSISVPVYVQIIQRMIARRDFENGSPGQYMIYHVNHQQLGKSPELYEFLYGKRPNPAQSKLF